MKPNPNTPSSSIITRNVADITGDNGNVYEAIAVISKRANQLSVKLKEELNDRFSSEYVLAIQVGTLASSTRFCLS